MPHVTKRPAIAGILILAASLAGGGVAVAQSPSAETPMEPPAPPTDLSGSIVISGSSTVQPVSTAVQELFNTGSPGVAITVDGPGTGDGFALFCAGETDISDASRAIEQDEIDSCAANGVEYVELKVALDGLSVITSAANADLTCLTFADLYALIGPESVGFGNWTDAQALATELGSSTVFPDAPLTITAPGEESGTYDFFIEAVIEPIAEGRGQDPVARPDYQASANDLTIVEGVAGTADNSTTLGWVGFAFVEENLDRIKPIAVDGGAGCVEPAYDVISDGTYPISRPLFIYVNKAKAAEKPELAGFVDYYLAPGVIPYVLQTVPYVGLSPEETQAALDAWTNR
jgi:phosphate transport system substrate-binding protein